MRPDGEDAPPGADPQGPPEPHLQGPPHAAMLPQSYLDSAVQSGASV